MKFPAEAVRAWERRALSTLDELGTTWRLQLRLPDAPRTPYPTLGPRRAPPPAQTNTELLDALGERGLHVFAVTDEMRREVLDGVRAEVRARGLFALSGVALATLVASQWRRVIVAHRRRGEGVPPVSAAWQARKATLGLSQAPLTASGQLLRAIEGAQLIVSKKG